MTRLISFRLFLRVSRAIFSIPSGVVRSRQTSRASSRSPQSGYPVSQLGRPVLLMDSRFSLGFSGNQVSSVLAFPVVAPKTRPPSHQDSTLLNMDTVVNLPFGFASVVVPSPARSEQFESLRRYSYQIKGPLHLPPLSSTSCYTVTPSRSAPSFSYNDEHLPLSTGISSLPFFSS